MKPSGGTPPSARRIFDDSSTDELIRQDIVEAVATNLDLRKPNREALESIAAVVANHYEVEKRTEMAKAYDPKEVEANAFAGEFLIPKAAVRRFMEEHGQGNKPTLDLVVRLAWRFGIRVVVRVYIPAIARHLCNRVDAIVQESPE